MENPLGQHLRELQGPVLLTGHTGFKGTWMTFLLEHLNVPVVGYSLGPEKDSLFDRARRTGGIPEIFADIRDYEALEKFIEHHKPSTIIHMAAQPLVLKSYETPHETFEVNVMGTANLLDIAFKKDFVKAIIVVTTDKVYKNDNSGVPFIESDPLGGKDPYSASKVGTEAVVSAWQQILRVSGGPKVISVRAGNVIGGGDFARDRLLPDVIRAFSKKSEVIIRSPDSTRPWQHVLEPLLGYLMALESILTIAEYEAYNFSSTEKPLSVREVIKIVNKIFPLVEFELMNSSNSHSRTLEAKFLALDSSLARDNLNWSPIWRQEEAIIKTLQWWSSYFEGILTPYELCIQEIESYLSNYMNKN
jgi:CDP-glucose 4,6-dehydratase